VPFSTFFKAHENLSKKNKQAHFQKCQTLPFPDYQLIIPKDSFAAAKTS